jgi:hypothetical protein
MKGGEIDGDGGGGSRVVVFVFGYKLRIHTFNMVTWYWSFNRLERN